LEKIYKIKKLYHSKILAWFLEKHISPVRELGLDGCFRQGNPEKDQGRKGEKEWCTMRRASARPS
jgi:hypothetical protein